MTYRTDLISVTPPIIDLAQFAGFYGEVIDVWMTQADKAIAVRVGGVDCPFSVVSANLLQFTCPSEAVAGFVEVTFVNAGTSTSPRPFSIYDPSKLELFIDPKRITDPRVVDLQDGVLQVQPFGIYAYTYNYLVQTSFGGVAGSIDWTARLTPWLKEHLPKSFYIWSSVGGAADGFAHLRVDDSRRFVIGIRGDESLAVPKQINYLEEGDEIEIRHIVEQGGAPGRHVLQARINGVWEVGYETNQGGDPGPAFNPPYNPNAFVLGALPPWKKSTSVALGCRMQSAAGLYVCSTAGTTASSGDGPTGTGTGISDGSAAWDFLTAIDSRPPVGLSFFSATPRAYLPAPEFIVFGDSTSAQGDIWRSIASSLYTPTERWLRPGIFSFAGGGETIATQKALWDASPLNGAASIKAFMIMIGYNDLAGGGHSAATITSDLQGFVNDLAASNPSTPIVVAQISPPGGSLSPTQYTVWSDVNDNIAGTGGTPITGITPMTDHIAILGTGTSPTNHQLKPQYDYGDSPHPNNGARRVIAAGYRRKLRALGLLP